MSNHFHEWFADPRDRRIAELEREVAALQAERPEGLAINDVAAERRRQVEKENWSAEHDDSHGVGTMAVAGACYALESAAKTSGEHQTWIDAYAGKARELWPWDNEWFKPKDPRRDLVRAAALIVAEIERMDREASRSPLATKEKP